MKRIRISFTIVFFLSILLAPSTSIAWEHHPLITRPVVAALPEANNAPSVPAVSLDDFLMAAEAALAEALSEQENWARTQLEWYAPRPEAFAFAATGNRQDIRERFFRAIRINPQTKTPLYISRLAEQPGANGEGLAPSEIALLPNTAGLERFVYQPVNAGDLLRPVDIVAAASNEPDYGMDVGLFTNNGTDFGATYGFGEQAFGNPNLDYGSQAPFHMGFYHEAKLVFRFAGFLKESYPEYRIHLYKSLSEFAFAQGQPYWGWRFMGWGLHYLADLSMPYHTTVLPGYSAGRMIFINLLDMLGISKPVDQAVQLVSNRHMAIERYQRLRFEAAVREQNMSHPPLAALSAPAVGPAYQDDMPRQNVAADSNRLAKSLDRAMEKYMPARFVSDPNIDLIDVSDVNQIVEMIKAEHGNEALDALDRLTAEALRSFAVCGGSYVRAILDAR